MTTGPTNRPTRPTIPAAPAELAQLPAEARFGKFVRVQKLGAGGMGEVWKAWDTELSRWVALKFMKGGDDDETARFLREARAAGRLNHPNIAAVYQVDERDGRPFIAMQYIDGATLGRVKGPLRERVRLLSEVARGVHYAHEQGVVHRDLKPENVMVESSSGRAFVMDFGLARMVGAGKSLTQSGVAIGTPSYMPPEQARGDVRSTDARSDVYSLGATLYAILCGRPPFDGTDLFSVLMKVVSDDPPPPRRLAPSVPADLETVVLKCLEKEPSRRYESAAALADDLDRWLGGEPVEARRVGSLQRVVRRAMRARAIAISAIAALLVIGAVGGGYAYTRWSAVRERERALERMRTTSASCLQAALDLRRAGNLKGMQAQAAIMEEACHAVLAERPTAEPHYHMGRMRRAQMQWAEARREQEEAIALDPDHAGARYELIVLRTVEFLEGIRAIRDRAMAKEGERRAAEGRGVVRSGTAKEIPLQDMFDDEARRAIDAIAVDVARLKAAPGVAAGHVEAAEALLARARHQDGSAVALRRVLETMPDEHEIRYALAGMLLSLGAPLDAQAQAEAAVALDPGYLPFREVQVDILSALGNGVSAAGQDGVPFWDRALAALDDMARIFPTRSAHRQARAKVLMNKGMHLHSLGREGLPLLEESVGEFSAVIGMEPRVEAGYRNRGRALSQAAVIRAARGMPWEALLADALADYDKAIALAPKSSDAWGGRGGVRRIRAVTLEDAGRDATADYEDALGDYAKSLEIDPVEVSGWYGRGAVNLDYAVFLFSRGRDPEPRLRASLEDLTEAIRLDEKYTYAVITRGLAHTNWAYFHSQTGRDPQPEYALSIDDFRRAIELNRGSDDAWLGLAVALKSLGTWRLNKGLKSAAETLNDALAAFGVLLKINPKRDEGWARRASLRVDLARVPGSEAGKHLKAALEDVEESLKINAKRSDTWASRGLVMLNIGILAYQAERDNDALDALAQSVKSLDESLRLNQNSADAWCYRGHAHRVAGTLLSVLDRQAEAKRQLEAAIADYQRAIDIKPPYRAELAPFIEDCRKRLR